MKFDLGDVPGWVALGLSTGAIWIALRSIRYSKQSAKAAEESAITAKRAHDFQEREVDRKRDHWQIMRDKSNPSIYVLREAGYSEKQGVKVKLSDGSDWAFNAIARGGQENIMGAVGLTGTVTWPEEPGNPDSFMRSWKFVLR